MLVCFTFVSPVINLMYKKQLVSTILAFNNENRLRVLYPGVNPLILFWITITHLFSKLDRFTFLKTLFHCSETVWPTYKSG